MAQKLKSQSQILSGTPSPTFSNFSSKTIQSNRAPTTADTGYEIGQLWANTQSPAMYGLVDVSGGVATWSSLGPGSSEVNTLTGDTGGALSPSGGTINIVGGPGLTVAGSGNTLTINSDPSGGFPVTPFVVGPSGQAGYTTIQAGISAAAAAGGGVVVVQPGTYTENLTLSSNCHVMGMTFADAGGGVIINGTHTPPPSGGFVFNNVELNSATAIFSSAVAGSTHLIIANAAVNVVNGYTFDLPNWTGKLECYDVNGRGGTNDGWINNAGGSEIAIFSAAIGAGTGNTLQASGVTTIFTCAVGCPMNFTTGSDSFLEYNVHLGPITFSDNSTGEIVGCEVDTGITMSSSAAWQISSTVINTATNPAIGGSGAGTLTLGDITFVSNSAIAGTLTTAFSNSTLGGVTSSGNSSFNGGTFTIGSDNLAHAITLGGTGANTITIGNTQTGGSVSIGAAMTTGTIGIGGTGAQTGTMTIAGGTGAQTINIANSTGGKTVAIATGAGANTVTLGSTNTTSTTTINAGSGGVQVAGDVNLTTGNLAISTSGKKIQLKGGAVTDFIGTATLTAGTVTVANTNIAAGDRIFIQRQSVNGSTAIGNLTYTISASTSFTITSVQDASPGTTETNDVSIVMYFIVRQI